MTFKLQNLMMGMLFAATAAMIPSQAIAQDPPPGAIFDLSTVNPGVLDTYTQFSTTFVADSTTEDVSFAFREVPAYFSFDDACVTATNCTTGNLLSDPGFEASAGVVGSNFPVGWDRWIQPVDTEAIGEVDSTGYGCGDNPHSGTIFWCDGSVQGYDALYQQLTDLVVGTTYTVSWWLDDNSDQDINNPNIDMLVYAGDEIPIGTMTIGTGPSSVTPEPSSLLLLGTGILGIAAKLRSMRKK